MKKSIKNQILTKIKQRKRGWAFSAFDFTQDFKRREIDESLSYLTEDGEIRRVIRGIYDYPLYSTLLKKNVASDINQVAYALARKFNWKIYPDGDTALNYLGLSTQVVAKSIYLTDGPSKKYTVGNRSLEFKHTTQREAALKHTDTALVIQSIKAIGEKQITPKFLDALAEKFSAVQWQKIQTDASKATGWVYEIIKKLADKAKDSHNG
ncbi:MAG: DUF6088 family protein [Alphaproteobacteria bacterium]|nr:DUF6088 family protein [Alphaproteobacteria bacterium]